jgi:hypothetical protein
MTSKKNYEYYDIFKKSCSYENGEGECTKTRESKKCVDGNCEKIVVPQSKKEVLVDYYNQIKYDNEENVNYKQIKDSLKFKKQQSDQDGGGKNLPKNMLLYNSVKKAANKKFKSPSGIYRSSWIVKEYLRRGGKYSGSKNKNSGLSRWFKEKWVDINRPIKNSKGKIIGYKSCGRKTQKTKGKYPLCRPSKSVNKKSPRTYKEISNKSLKKAKKDKKSSKKIKFGGGDQNGGDRKKSKMDKQGNIIKGDVISIKKEEIMSTLLHNLKDKYKYKDNLDNHLSKHNSDNHLSKHNSDKNISDKNISDKNISDKNISDKYKKCNICNKEFNRATFYKHMVTLF